MAMQAKTKRLIEYRNLPDEEIARLMHLNIRAVRIWYERLFIRYNVTSREQLAEVVQKLEKSKHEKQEKQKVKRREYQRKYQKTHQKDYTEKKREIKKKKELSVIQFLKNYIAAGGIRHKDFAEMALACAGKGI